MSKCPRSNDETKPANRRIPPDEPRRAQRPNERIVANAIKRLSPSVRMNAIVLIGGRGVSRLGAKPGAAGVGAIVSSEACAAMRSKHSSTRRRLPERAAAANAIVCVAAERQPRRRPRAASWSSLGSEAFVAAPLEEGGVRLAQRGRRRLGCPVLCGDRRPGAAGAQLA